MAKKAFRAIADGLVDAINSARGSAASGRLRRPEILNIDVASLRNNLGLSQSEFAQGFGVSLGTLRNWEQHRRNPEGPARVLLTIIEKNPKRVVETLWPTVRQKANRRGAKVAA